MYLLRAQETDTPGSLDVKLELHVDNVPPYAILSHRWGSPADEPTLQELMVQTASVKQKKGYQKLLSCCSLALEYGLSYVWIDTCCIDKSSSAELSEAINSMYSWYQDSHVCFAYMEDVPPGDDIMDVGSAFRKSVWFTRGWTLQELIAPNEVIFFDSHWESRTLGSKSTLHKLLSSITGIQEEILSHREKPHTASHKDKLQIASVAQKMCWASRRRTTRVEDEAYSLMGIFGVSMPTVYGEGRKAFFRLQEEIMKGSADHTIFAWDSDEDHEDHKDHEYQGMLANSPRLFWRSGNFTSMSYNEFINRYHLDEAEVQPYYTMTNFGLQIQLPVISMSPYFEGYYFSFLAAFHIQTSWYPRAEKGSVIIFLRQRDDRPARHFVRTHFNGRTLIHRRMPDGGYKFRMPALLSYISGNNPRRSTIASSTFEREYDKAISDWAKSRNDNIVTKLAKLTVVVRSQRGLAFQVSTCVAKEFFHGSSPPFKHHHIMSKVPLSTVLTRGQTVFAQVSIADVLSPEKKLNYGDQRQSLSALQEFVASIAFGLHEGKTWAHVSLHDQIKTTTGADPSNETEKYDIFSGVSCWQHEQDSVLLYDQKDFGPGRGYWDLGGCFSAAGEILLSVSLHPSQLLDNRLAEWTLSIVVSELETNQELVSRPQWTSDFQIHRLRQWHRFSS